LDKKQQTALNMAKFIPGQSLFLLEKLHELNLDSDADLCEKLHEYAEYLYHSLSGRLNDLQDGE